MNCSHLWIAGMGSRRVVGVSWAFAAFELAIAVVLASVVASEDQVFFVVR